MCTVALPIVCFCDSVELERASVLYHCQIQLSEQRIWKEKRREYIAENESMILKRIYNKVWLEGP